MRQCPSEEVAALLFAREGRRRWQLGRVGQLVGWAGETVGQFERKMKREFKKLAGLPSVTRLNRAGW
jgi:hypothetical protein